MSGNAISDQPGPLGELTAVGVRVQRLADGLERLPALDGMLTIYGDLLTDPLARLAVISGPAGEAQPRATPEPFPAAVPTYTWPAATWPATTRPTRAPGDGAAPGSAPTAAPSNLPTSRTAAHQTAAGGAPVPTGPLPASRRISADAPAARLTRNGTTLAALLHANLAHPTDGPDRGPAPTGLEHLDGPAAASYPDPAAPLTPITRSPRAASPEMDGWPGGSDHRSPSEDTGPVSGPEVREPGEVERPGSIDPGPITPLGGRAAAYQRSVATLPARLDGESGDTRHWPEPIRAGEPDPMLGALPGTALTPAPADRMSPANGQSDSGRLDDHVVWAEPAVPDERAGARHRLRSPGEVAAAGTMPSLDDVLEALADQLELALLRAYGTSGG